jgi:hypothetical protein
VRLADRCGSAWRAFLRWTIADLSKRAGIGEATVKVLEAVDVVLRSQHSSAPSSAIGADACAPSPW